MPTQPTTQSVAPNTSQSGKKLQNQLVVNALFLALALIVFPLILIPGETTLGHRFPSSFGWDPHTTQTPASYYPMRAHDLQSVFTSAPSVALDVTTACLVGFVLWTRFSRLKTEETDEVKDDVPYWDK